MNRKELRKRAEGGRIRVEVMMKQADFHSRRFDELLAEMRKNV